MKNMVDFVDKMCKIDRLCQIEKKECFYQKNRARRVRHALFYIHLFHNAYAGAFNLLAERDDCNICTSDPSASAMRQGTIRVQISSRFQS